MNQQNILKFITKPRISKYSSLDGYKLNILESQKYYSSLAILEVALRNAINSTFCAKLGDNWLIENNFLKIKQIQQVENAKALLESRKEHVTQDKLVAELNFGFWTSLFSKVYDKQMRISILVKIFNNLPKKEEKLVNRHILGQKLNKIRIFRNRIFHYEKITNKPEFADVDDTISEMLSYLDKELLNFLAGVSI
ncbi:Abi family protein [Francisella hispaniensis]|uniref:CAAX protease n=1 Tax=Francisella hispaniensis FSC454 TaxID=1088883 RepID=A0AAC9J5J7_9GAMM|nr:Abi family protein [Francisella hispaniensis]APD50420.1 hypothetical protein FSC454_04405 [Francisella hispaniensis FSC454]KYW84754.1 hypothetical protein AUF42_05540 [Francisella hispaniensis FSC454]